MLFIDPLPNSLTQVNYIHTLHCIRLKNSKRYLLVTLLSRKTYYFSRFRFKGIVGGGYIHNKQYRAMLLHGCRVLCFSHPTIKTIRKLTCFKKGWKTDYFPQLTRQKRFAKQQRSSVINALACVYCYFLRAERTGWRRKKKRATLVSC